MIVDWESENEKVERQCPVLLVFIFSLFNQVLMESPLIES